MTTDGSDRPLLQRGHGRGASPSKSSIRVTRSHSPHHGGRRRAGGGGTSAGESRAARTAPELRIPAVFAPTCSARAAVAAARQGGGDGRGEPAALPGRQHPPRTHAGEPVEELPSLRLAARGGPVAGAGLARTRGG